MMRSSAYNRFGVLMGTSWPASCPRWYGLREDSLPMITLFPSQGDFYATAKEVPAHAHLQPSCLLTPALSAGDHLCCNAASTFSAVMGKSWIRTPTAS